MLVVANSTAVVAALANPTAVIAALAAAGEQMVQVAPRICATETIAAFLRPEPMPSGGSPQCSGPIQYRPRKTRGVFVRKAPALCR